MTTISRLGKLSPFLSLAARFAQDRRGASAIEFAFMVPILLTMYLGSMELGQGIETNKKLSRATSMIGDLVTQEQALTKADINGILVIGESILQPYYRSRPVITITSIKIDASSVGKVSWRRKIQAGVTSGSAATSEVVPLPADLKIPNSVLIKVETELTYLPVLTSMQDAQGLGYKAAFGSIPMKEEYFLRPRQSKEVICTDC